MIQRNTEGFSGISNLTTLRQKLIHPKDRTPKPKLSAVVYVIQSSENCTASHIGETKHRQDKHIARHRRDSSSRQDSAEHFHHMSKGHTFENQSVQILERGLMVSKWCEGSRLCEKRKAITEKRGRTAVSASKHLQFKGIKPGVHFFNHCTQVQLTLYDKKAWFSRTV